MRLSEQWEKLPIFKKAMDIKKLIEHLSEAVERTEIDYDPDVSGDIQDEMVQSSINFMRENSMIIPAKIAGAAKDDMPYDIRMENAAIIRKAAREILTDAMAFEMHGFQDVEYLDLLRDEIEEFRVLFAEWVKSFDQWNYIIDRWGLFNPPGVDYDDIDPDDDIPFDPDGFFGEQDDD